MQKYFFFFLSVIILSCKLLKYFQMFIEKWSRISIKMSIFKNAPNGFLKIFNSKLVPWDLTDPDWWVFFRNTSCMVVAVNSINSRHIKHPFGRWYGFEWKKCLWDDYCSTQLHFTVKLDTKQRELHVLSLKQWHDFSLMFASLMLTHIGTASMLWCDIWTETVQQHMYTDKRFTGIGYSLSSVKR